MARVEDIASEEDEEPEIIIDDDVTEQEEIDNESEASDDMSESEEAERVLDGKATELENELLKDPYNYDQHIQLIELLDKLSDLERLRAAFQRLHSVYPLQPEHWLLWLQAEASVAHSQRDRQAVHDLYETATAEAYSTQLYLQWLMFAMSGTAEEARTVFAKVTRRAGYDPPNLGAVWRSILDYEQMHLGEISDCDKEALREQVDRIAGYMSQHYIRHTHDSGNDLLDMLKEFATRYSGCMDWEPYIDNVVQQQESLQEVREKVAHYEDTLVLAGLEEKPDIYLEYISTLREMQEERRQADSPFNLLEMCANLYDRATYECLNCESVDRLFGDYARLAARLGSEGERALKVCTTRRPHVVEYCLLSMQHLERLAKPLEEITGTLERTLAARSLSRQEGESLWLGYLECVRRTTDWESEDSRQKLRSNMNHAADALASMYGDEADSDCELSLFWARLEYNRLDDPARGKEIFENLFLDSYNKCQSRLWLALLELESTRRPRPPDKKLRDLHRRAVRYTEDYPPAVCERWIAFERDYGSLDTMIQCRDACQEALEKWKKSYEQKNEAKQNAKKGKNKAKKQNVTQDGAENEKKEQTRGKKRTAEDDGGDGVKKKKEEVKQNGLKRHSDDNNEAGESKKARTEEDSSVGSASGDHVSPEKEACTLFVSNLDFKFNESSLRQVLSAYGTITAMRFVRGVKAFGGSICYCEYTTSESVDEAIKHDRTPLDGRPMFLSRYKPSRGKETKFRYATMPERNKLFVKNLPYSLCTQEKLRELYEKYGNLKDVRVVTHKSGRPKGLAYIEYADDKSASAALQATDSLELDGRKIEVALSAPPPRESTPAATNTARRRTQLGSGLVPRVLQKPIAPTATITSTPPTASTSKQMTNSDFRNMLLNKK